MNSEKGLAMIFGIISIFILLVLGGILFFLSYRESRVGALSMWEKEAFFAAEAGGGDALAWIDGRVDPPLIGLNDTIFRSGRLSEGQRFNTTIQLINVSIVPGASVDERDYTFRITTQGSGPCDAQRDIEMVASKLF
jgi:Tfp pilus assembly protein PilX